MPSRPVAEDPLNLIICGVGGQGNVLASRLVGKAFNRLGYSVCIGETFGVSQRGGAVMSHIRVSKDNTLGPLIPRGMAHIVLGLEPMETLRILGDYGNPEVVTLSNTREIIPIKVSIGSAEYPNLEKLYMALNELSSRCYLIRATDTALEMGAPIVANVIMLGALLALDLLPITPAEFEDTLRDTLPSSRLELNLAAFNRGLELVSSLL